RGAPGGLAQARGSRLRHGVAAAAERRDRRRRRRLDVARRRGRRRGRLRGDRRGGRDQVVTDEPITQQEEESQPEEESPEQDELGALQAERDELFDRLQRLAAEFDNFRKRAAREQGEVVARANERLVKELLPVLDDLGRALEAAAEHEEG